MEAVDTIPGDAALKALAALVTAVFAATLLAGAPRKPANRLLALFFLLIAGNQAFEMLRALAPDDAWALTWFRLASFCAALDPLALLLFVVAHQGARGRLARAAWLAGAVAVLLAFWALVLARLPDGFMPFTTALTLYTVVAYGTLVVVLARALLARPDDAPLRLLAPAFLLVSFHTALETLEHLAGLAGRLMPTLTGTQVFLAGFGADVAFSLLAVGACALARRRAAGARRDAWSVLLKAAAAGAVLSFAIRAYHFELLLDHVTGEPREPIFALMGRAGAAVRWLLFGALVSTAVVRHDALGMSLAARRRAARALVALLVLTPAILLVALPAALVGPALADLRPFDLVFLAAAVGLSQGFRTLVDRVAHRVYGVPMPADVHGRHETYRLAAMQAASEGRSAGRDARLARLREELGLDAGTAEVLERLAEESAGGALAEGGWIAARYRVGPLLGAGAAARAFLAHDDLLDRPVVLKEVPTGPGDEHDLVLREARLAGGLQHPHVLVVHDVLRRRGFTVLVMEHAAGGALSALLERGPPPEPVARRLLDEVLAGLAVVHAKGVVHRDLKPANVLLGADGRVKLADFGIARLREGATLDGGGPLVGTPEFMAPEQWRGEPATPATDVYAAGLLGRRLFGDAPPADVARVLARALAQRPEERWRDAGEMRAALRGHVQ